MFSAVIALSIDGTLSTRSTGRLTPLCSICSIVPSIHTPSQCPLAILLDRDRTGPEILVDALPIPQAGSTRTLAEPSNAIRTPLLPSSPPPRGPSRAAGQHSWYAARWCWGDAVPGHAHEWRARAHRAAWPAHSDAVDGVPVRCHHETFYS